MICNAQKVSSFHKKSVILAFPYKHKMYAGEA